MAAIVRRANTFLAWVKGTPCASVITQDDREAFAKILNPRVAPMLDAVQCARARFPNRRVRLELLAMEVDLDVQMYFEVDMGVKKQYVERLTFWLNAAPHL